MDRRWFVAQKLQCFSLPYNKADPGISRIKGLNGRPQKLEIYGLCFTSSGDKGLPSSQVFSSSTGW